MATGDQRRPFIRFEVKTIEDRAATQQSGVMAYKDVDFIIMVPHGSEGKTELCEIYPDWLHKIKQQLGPVRAAGADTSTPFMVESRFPREWVEDIEKGYAAWKKGEEIPVVGTSLKQWAVIPKAMMQNCIANHIFTIEQLAEASDEAINPVGMGARLYRNRAQDWIKLNKDNEINKAVIEVNALREDNARLSAQVSGLMTQVGELVKRIPNTEPQRTMELHNEKQGKRAA